MTIILLVHGILDVYKTHAVKGCKEVCRYVCEIVGVDTYILLGHVGVCSPREKLRFRL